MPYKQLIMQIRRRSLEGDFIHPLRTRDWPNNSMDRQPGKPSGLCSPGTRRILILLKIRAFRYSIHTEPPKSDAL